ncbi:MAG: DUF1667 domain-containing protein [Clostridia bacterium]|nr:DUF1667 domain-containing protein [Clostridia bacterium]MDY5264894.1 DUF1667 domain-containing protein [Eubacteriales bacterium]MDY5440558.1 DUF1667 domain-containing protein [Eubacteriales bacterium]
MIKNITCINCPMGCPLTVEINGDDIKVSGNTCKRGDVYGKQEVTSPKRVVTSLVRIKDGAVVSCKTNAAIDKAMIFKVLDELRKVEVTLPVKIGDVIIENVLGTGADIVATCNKN